MKRTVWTRLTAMVLVVLLAVSLLMPALAEKTITVYAADYPLTKDGYYSTMEEVAVYLRVFGRLPNNFITKKEAEGMGWNNREGNLDEVAPGCSIGGDRFGNYEGILPDANGRKWTECDIDFDGSYRNAKRIVFSNDNPMLIYYTDDHYESFALVDVVMDENGGKKEDKPAPAAEEIQGVCEEYQELEPVEDEEYLTAGEVATYVFYYGHLPSNYLTKSEAEDYGFTNKKDNLGEVMPGCAIGGDSFGNREGLLPDEKGRKWYQCDVNTEDGKRGSERLVYSNDGLIYYSPDNFESFVKLY